MDKMCIGIYTVSSQSGRAYLADFLQRGISCYGYARLSENGKKFVETVNRAKGIQLERPNNTNHEKSQFLSLYNGEVGHDLCKMVNDSNYILLAQPSHYFMDSIKELIKCGIQKKRIPIILSPSRSFSSLYAWQLLGKDYPIVCFSTCPFSCKAPDSGTSYIKRRKRSWVVSLEGVFTQKQISQLSELFPQAVFSNVSVVTSLGNIGAMLHPTAYIMNYEKIKRAELERCQLSFYMECIANDPQVGHLIEQIDEMRLQIAHDLGYTVYGLDSLDNDMEWNAQMNLIANHERGVNNIIQLRKIRHDGLENIKNCVVSCKHWLDYTYGVCYNSSESLSETIRRTPTYQVNSLPQKRYVEEDVATGLIPITNMAKRMGICTDAADYVLDMCQEKIPNRNKIYDRTLEEFSDEYLMRYLKGEFFLVED